MRKYPYTLPSYNGFDHDARVTVNPLQRQLLKSGAIQPATVCSICGFSDLSDPRGRGYIYLHLEDYERPDAILPACKKCHPALHARFKDPERWLRVLDRNWQPGRWFTLITFDPGSQFAPYLVTYPGDLPTVNEVWPENRWPKCGRDVAERLEQYRSRMNQPYR